MGIGLACVSVVGWGICSATASASPITPPTRTVSLEASHPLGPTSGCSTAIAPAPTLDGVRAPLSSGPIEPFGVAISANSRSGYVADASGAVYVYSLQSPVPAVQDVDSFRVTSVDGIPPRPGVSVLGLALTPNGRYLIAADNRGGAVVFNVAHLAKQHSNWSAWHTGTLQSDGQGAIETAVSPNGDFAFVTLENSDELAVFNLKRALLEGFRPSDLIGMVPLGVAPVGVAISPDGRYLYVTSEAARPLQTEGTLTTISVARAEQVPARAVISIVSAGCSPVRVVATRTAVFVSARGSDAVLSFSARDLVVRPSSALDGEVQVGESPVGLALVDDDRWVMVSDSDRFAVPGTGANLAAVEIASSGRMKLAGYISSGSFPRDMAASPDGKILLVDNFGSGQVEAVDVADLPQVSGL